jgi:hypothetical protein
MMVKITIEVPEALGEQVLRLRERLPEILEYGLRQVTDEMSDDFSAVGEYRENATSLIASLKRHAYMGNYRAFVDRVKTIDWAMRQPEELAATLDLALRLDMSKLAQNLAQLGARLFPDDVRLQRAARVLAPPVVSVHVPRAKGLAASRRWFREHAHQYKGQWVAVREGQLLGVASSLDELEGSVPGIFGGEQDILDTVVTKVT